MQITDTIADLLTRIRNANSAKHDSVEIPASNLKKSICQILVDEGYVKNFTVIEDGKQGVIKVTLKYTGKKAAHRRRGSRLHLVRGGAINVSNWKKTYKYSRRRYSFS